MSEHMRSENHDQAQDHVDDRDARKHSRNPAFDVVENRQESQVFAVEDLLLV